MLFRIFMNNVLFRRFVSFWLFRLFFFGINLFLGLISPFQPVWLNMNGHSFLLLLMLPLRWNHLHFNFASFHIRWFNENFTANQRQNQKMKSIEFGFGSFSLCLKLFYTVSFFCLSTRPQSDVFFFVRCFSFIWIVFYYYFSSALTPRLYHPTVIAFCYQFLFTNTCSCLSVTVIVDNFHLWNVHQQPTLYLCNFTLRWWIWLCQWTYPYVCARSLCQSHYCI